VGLGRRRRSIVRAANVRVPATQVVGRGFRNANQLVIKGSQISLTKRLSSGSQLPIEGGSPDACTPHATSASHAALRSCRQGGTEERRIS
jgi:hypothetical protein